MVKVQDGNADLLEMPMQIGVDCKDEHLPFGDVRDRYVGETEANERGIGHGLQRRYADFCEEHHVIRQRGAGSGSQMNWLKPEEIRNLREDMRRDYEALKPNEEGGKKGVVLGYKGLQTMRLAERMVTLLSDDVQEEKVRVEK